MSYNFAGKNVWVTGASSGIGLALAQKLLADGANVVVSARSLGTLQSVFSGYSNALILSGDLTSIEVNQEIVERAEKTLGPVDCAILNAGTAEYIDIKDFSYKPFERMMQTNFLSMVKSVHAVLPSLRKSNDPYLVGMSSSVAWQGLPQGQAYSASKAAIRNLFQGLKIELEQENIQVSWICPGFIKTPLTDKNTFDMPFRISAEQGVNTLVRELQKQTTEIHFPKRFTCLLKWLSFLPAGFSAKLLKGTVPAR